MKLLYRVLSAVIICLIAIPAMAYIGPVQAAQGVSLSASSGYVGDKITVSGDNITYRDRDIYIRYQIKGSEYETIGEAYVDENGDFSHKVEIPESCGGEHDIAIDDNESGTPSLPSKFTVKPKVEVISPQNAEGYVGDQIKVKGTGFAEDEGGIEVWYFVDSGHQDFSAGPANEDGSWEKTFTVPASARGSHRIDADGRSTDYTAVKDASFTVLRKMSLNATSACVGDTIRVTGTGFESREDGILVKLNTRIIDDSVDIDEYGSWELDFTVPEGSTSGTYEVKACKGSNVLLSADFTLAPRLIVSPVTSPTSPGHVGQTVTVTGTGFAAGTNITITYDGVAVGNASVTSEGTFPAVEFAATHTQTSHTVNHTVAAMDSLGHSLATGYFVMESAAPGKLSLISPVGGERVGFFDSYTGNIRPTFRWSNVADPSGIASYKLEISTDSSFGAGTIQLVLSSANVSISDNSVAYTLGGDNALSYGTYYWRARAVDGAQNQGEWSEAQAFHAGLLPQWAAITITALVVVLIGVLVYYFRIVRRRYVNK